MKRVRLMADHAPDCDGRWAMRAAMRPGPLNAHAVLGDSLGRFGNGGRFWDRWDCSGIGCHAYAYVLRSAVRQLGHDLIENEGRP